MQYLAIRAHSRPYIGYIGLDVPESDQYPKKTALIVLQYNGINHLTIEYSLYYTLLHNRNY